MGDGEEQQQLDETGVKKIILQFEKRALRNQVWEFSRICCRPIADFSIFYNMNMNYIYVILSVLSS